MSSLLLEVVGMLGGTIAKVVPITIVPALVFSVLGAGVVFNIHDAGALVGTRFAVRSSIMVRLPKSERSALKSGSCARLSGVERICGGSNSVE